jgi:hypothetical protein
MSVCPEMVIVPAGTFTMGSPPSEAGRRAPQGLGFSNRRLAGLACRHDAGFGRPLFR